MELGNPLVCMEEGDATKTFLPDRNPRHPSSSGKRRKAERANRILNGMQPALSQPDLPGVPTLIFWEGESENPILRLRTGLFPPVASL